MARLASRAEADGTGKMFFVYVLKSKSVRKFYTGHTNDLERRLSEHNKEQGEYSSRYAPWEIVYKERCGSLAEAVRKEKYLKSAAGRRWLKVHISL